MKITLSLPWLLLCLAVVFTVGGIAINYWFPNRGEFMGWPVSGPNLPGVLLFLIGVAFWLVVFGLWIAGAFAAKGGA